MGRPQAKKTKALRSCLQRSQKIMWKMGRRIQAFWWRERQGSEGGVGGNSLERKRVAVLQVDFTALKLLILIKHSLLVLVYYASSASLLYNQMGLLKIDPVNTH